MYTEFGHVHIMCGDVEKAAKYFVDIFEGKRGLSWSPDWVSLH